MAYILRQGGRTDYNYKEFYIDTAADLASIKLDDVCPGSVAYVIATSVVYILNNKKEWIQQ